jgi:CRISPR-associated endonuclease Cas2
MINRYLIAYDVADADRLRKVHNVVKARAVRVQDSVYEACLTERELVLFEDKLRQVMNLKEDQVMFIDLGAAHRTEIGEVSVMGVPWQPVRRSGSVVL